MTLGPAGVVWRARWVLPIARPPIRDGWIEVDGDRVVRLGEGTAPGPATDLGDVALLPGLVNAHTHLELSGLAGRVPPAASMATWISTLMRVRREEAPALNLEQMTREAALSIAASGTALVGDISNTLTTPAAIADAGLGGIVFHELLGFNSPDVRAQIASAQARVRRARAEVAHATPPVRIALAAHAPYSVSPALFAAIAAESGPEPLTVHLGESREEMTFLETGLGPIRQMIERLGVWNPAWPVPACDPVEYLARVDYLRPGLLAVHGVYLTDEALRRLRDAGGAIITCPRSNVWVGAGQAPVSRFYAAGLRVAIGTDSLASTSSLSIFDEIAAAHEAAPDVEAACLIDSATRVGADVLGFGETHGTLAPGKRPGFVSVSIPPGVTDVEQYLVSGVPAESVRRLQTPAC